MTNTPSIVQTAQPFLLAVCRMPGAIADDELETIIDWGRLDPNSGIETISLVDEDAVDPASLDLSRYSGVIITGSPFGFGQDENRKSREHQVMAASSRSAGASWKRTSRPSGSASASRRSSKRSAASSSGKWGESDEEDRSRYEE